MSVVCDNMKQYVVKPDRYEPAFNSLAEQWAVYYNTALMAARVGKPKDKPSVEKGVHISYLRIFAPLRNRTFLSLSDLNHAVMECLDIHNNMPMKGHGLSRKQRFETEELSPILTLLSAMKPGQRYSAIIMLYWEKICTSIAYLIFMLEKK